MESNATENGESGLSKSLAAELKKLGRGVAFAAIAEDAPEKQPAEEKKPIVTEDHVTINGIEISYSVETGTMPIRDEKGNTEAELFYVYYRATAGVEFKDRPLLFAFNGGPGSSSVWLHLGTIGPRRVDLGEEGFLPAPPYRLLENEHSWLDLCDVVFIDPVGTGYSKATKPDNGKKFWTLSGDINSVGEFIRLFLSRNSRWSSPLFLVGESYGTTRAAGLSGALIDKGIAFNGIILVSTVMNFQTLIDSPGNDLPYILFLPTYAATALFHDKLSPELAVDPAKTLTEVESWARDVYSRALFQGDSLPAKDRKAIVEALSRFTGLSHRFIEQNNLRVEIHRFCKELLREEGEVVGRLDSRIKGVDRSQYSEFPDTDPSMSAIRPPYTAMMNHYVRTVLGYETDHEYQILGMDVNRSWNWELNGDSGHVDTSHALRDALSKNPHMKVMVAAGTFDLATPYLAAQYTLDHMGIDPTLRGNINIETYEAGHMMYIQTRSLVKLKEDVTRFMLAAVGGA